MQCSVLLYSLLYKYCCTAVWRLPPPQCSYCSRHRLSGRRSYLHPQFTAQLVGTCSYWHLGTEHVFLWPCAYYYYFLRLKFLTTKFLTGDAVCMGTGGEGWVQPVTTHHVALHHKLINYQGQNVVADMCGFSLPDFWLRKSDPTLAQGAGELVARPDQPHSALLAGLYYRVEATSCQAERNFSSLSVLIGTSRASMRVHLRWSR